MKKIILLQSFQTFLRKSEVLPCTRIPSRQLSGFCRPARICPHRHSKGKARFRQSRLLFLLMPRAGACRTCPSHRAEPPCYLGLDEPGGLPCLFLFIPPGSNGLRGMTVRPNLGTEPSMTEVGWTVQSAFQDRNSHATRESSPGPCREAAQSNHPARMNTNS